MSEQPFYPLQQPSTQPPPQQQPSAAASPFGGQQGFAQNPPPDPQPYGFTQAPPQQQPAAAPFTETPPASPQHNAPLPSSTPATPATPTSPSRQRLQQLREEIGKAVVGQDSVVSGLVIALLCRGHVLLEGVPGVAKTLLVRSLAQALMLQTARIQFTPDLMPGDVTGSLIYDARTGQFSFREGPVFTNLLLGDEINRTPPKTQSSLLEAMEERQVSVDGQPRPLPDPFVVIATQNPVEYEGTYPLPEAQVDRFLLKLVMNPPERNDEVAILSRHLAGFDPRDLAAAGLGPVANAEDLATARREMEHVSVSPEVLGYIVDICRATRATTSVQLGVSPRGATALLRTSHAWAWLVGRDYVTPDDVKALARPTLAHRLQLSPESELEGMRPDTVLDAIINTVPTPR